MANKPKKPTNLVITSAEQDIPTPSVAKLNSEMYNEKSRALRTASEPNKERIQKVNDIINSSPGFFRCKSIKFDSHGEGMDSNDVRCHSNSTPFSLNSTFRPSTAMKFSARRKPHTRCRSGPSSYKHYSDPLVNISLNEEDDVASLCSETTLVPVKSEPDQVSLLNHLSESLTKIEISETSFTRFRSSASTDYDDDSFNEEDFHSDASSMTQSQSNTRDESFLTSTSTSPDSDNVPEVSQSPVLGIKLTDADIDVLCDTICIDYTLDDAPVVEDADEHIDINSLPTLASIPYHWNIHPSYDRSYSSPFSYEYYANRYNSVDENETDGNKNGVETQGAKNLNASAQRPMITESRGTASKPVTEKSEKSAYSHRNFGAGKMYTAAPVFVSNLRNASITPEEEKILA